MSTVGLRSFEYQRATDVDQTLRDLVERVSRESEDPAATLQARMRLALQLETLAELLEPLAEDATIPLEQSLLVPVPMLRRLRDTSLNGKHLPVSLKETVKRLKGKDELIEDDRELFRIVLDAAAHEASDAFDRVVRR